MPGTLYSTSVDIKISAAVNQPFTPTDETIEVVGRQDPTGIGRDIRRVSVTNSINSPFGRFTIELAPRTVHRGLTWAQLIKPASRVSISFHRMGPLDDPFATRQPVPIMVGTVDTAELSEDFSQAAPRRTSRITGRSLSSLLTDQRWWYHPLLSVAGASGRVELPEFRDFVIGQPPTEGTVRRESDLRSRGLLAVDQDLYFVTNQSPARCMGAAFRFFVVNTSAGDPFIQVHYADALPLSDLLRFDEDLAAARYFDPSARMLTSQLPTQLPNASCWDILAHFNEPPYQEIFSEVRGASLADAFVEVVARKPPFAGVVGDPNGRASVVFDRGRPPALRGETLFSEQEPGWDRYADTIYVGDGSGGVSATPSMRRTVEGSGQIFTMYYVTPRLAPMTSRQDQSTWGQYILPIIDGDPESPS